MLSKEYLESISKDRIDLISEDKLDAYIEQTQKDIRSLRPVADSFVRARNKMEINAFVIHKHDSRLQQYKQALVEFSAKESTLSESQYNLKQSLLRKERKQLLLQRLKSIQSKTNWYELEQKNECVKTVFNDDEYGNLEKVFYNAREVSIEIEDVQYQLEKIDTDTYATKLAMVGALKECENFNDIIQNEFSDFLEKTEDELAVLESDYWLHRFSKQIAVDYITKGIIGEGNLSSLMCLPKNIQEEIYALAGHKIDQHKEIQFVGDKIHRIEKSRSVPLLSQATAPQSGVFYPLKLAKDAPDWYPANRIVMIDKAEIVIASLHRPLLDEHGNILVDENGNQMSEQNLSDSFWIPTGKNYIQAHQICPHEDMIGDYRNQLVESALSIGADFIFIVDDDLIVPEDALLKLFSWDLDVVGGWYLKKTPYPESASMIRSGLSKIPVPLRSEGLIEIDWVITSGCLLIKTDVFRKFSQPWFNTTTHGTDDTNFSQRAIDAGFRIFLDTDVKCIHVDKNTGKQYSIEEGIKILEEKKLKKEEALAKKNGHILKQIK